MSSLLACNAKHGFLYLAYQHKEVTRMTFAEKLKSIRKKAGLSQEQLAEKLGVSRQAVTKNLQFTPCISMKTVILYIG